MRIRTKKKGAKISVPGKSTNWHADAVSEKQILLQYGDKNGHL